MGTSYNPRIVTDGLVLCLDAANARSYPGTGTAWTDLKGGNNGTLTNGPTFSSDNGGSIVFDGSNDYIGLGDVLNLNKITISIWFKLNSLSGRQFLVGKWESGKRSYQISFNQSGFPAGTISSAISTDGQLSAVVESNVNGVINSTSKYYHICMTANGNYLNTYVDGKQENSVSAGSPYSAGNAHLAIGTILFSDNTTPMDPANANIASASIYNRALTADEIRQNYLATKERYA